MFAPPPVRGLPNSLVRDTPHIAQLYLFEIVSQRGVSHALYLVHVVSRKHRWDTPFVGGHRRIAPPLRMLSKGETLRKGGGGIEPNWPCWDTQGLYHSQRRYYLLNTLRVLSGNCHVVIMGEGAEKASYKETVVQKGDFGESVCHLKVFRCCTGSEVMVIWKGWFETVPWERLWTPLFQPFVQEFSEHGLQITVCECSGAN